MQNEPFLSSLFFPRSLDLFRLANGPKQPAYSDRQLRFDLLAVQINGNGLHSTGDSLSFYRMRFRCHPRRHKQYRINVN